jgi:hypothetical protein
MVLLILLYLRSDLIEILQPDQTSLFSLSSLLNRVKNCWFSLFYLQFALFIKWNNQESESFKKKVIINPDNNEKK